VPLKDDALLQALQEATGFPREAIPMMRGAVERAFPNGADDQCAASVDDEKGALVLADGRLYFVRYVDDTLRVSTLDALRHGVLTTTYRPGGGNGFSEEPIPTISYVSPRGTINIEVVPTASAAIDALRSWSQP
jgi:hypothetical protein